LQDSRNSLEDIEIQSLHLDDDITSVLCYSRYLILCDTSYQEVLAAIVSRSHSTPITLDIDAVDIDDDESLQRFFHSDVRLLDVTLGVSSSSLLDSVSLITATTILQKLLVYGPS